MAKRLNKAECMSIDSRLYGYTFNAMGVDYFIETERKYKTEGLCKEILSALGWDVKDKTIKTLYKYLLKAHCEVIHLSNGRAYFEIAGDNFGGLGGFLDRDNTVIIRL